MRAAMQGVRCLGRTADAGLRWLAEVTARALRLLQRFAVLGQIEAFDLVLLAHPQWQEESDRLEENVSQHAGPDEDCDDGVELDQHLPGIALEQSWGTLRRVRTSGQHRHREHAREQRAGRAADAVNAEYVERIVVPDPPLQPRAGPEADRAGDEANDDAVPGQHEARCRRDGAETGDGAPD